MVSDSDHLKDKRVIFYKEDVDRINAVLNEFLKLSDSKCNILIDKEGHMVTKAGSTGEIDLQSVSALVAGSYAATREMARLLGEDEFSVLFHQGRKDSIQLTLVGDRTILATVFDERTTIGMVRLYAKEASEKLEEIFKEIVERPTPEGGDDLGKDFGDSAKGALDFFFVD